MEMEGRSVSGDGMGLRVGLREVSSDRTLPCEVCGAEVVIKRTGQGRRYYARLVKLGYRPRCKQCRRYVSSGQARESQLPTEEEPTPSLGLTRKVKRGAKHKRGIESYPLRRMGERWE